MTLTTATVPGTYWQWRGQKIYYVHTGPVSSPYPPLLLIHGFGASTGHWRKNLAGLGDVFDVWAVDLLGFGRSAKPDWQYSGDLWCDQLVDFIEEVIQKPVILAGNSIGGYVCLSVAAKHSKSAAGLILLNSAGGFTQTQPTPAANPFQQVVKQTVQNVLLQEWATFLIFNYTRQKSVIRKTLEKVYLDKSAITEELIDDIYRPSCDSGALKVFNSVFKSPQGEKIDVLLSQLKLPLLMLWGEGDPWMNCRERGHLFRQFYPQLTEYYLQAGHCPHDEIPDQVNALIDSWVREKF